MFYVPVPVPVSVPVPVPVPMLIKYAEDAVLRDGHVLLQ